MDIKERILKLREMIPERGATEDEAFAAMQMADKLMQKHGITEDDLVKVEASRDMREGRRGHNIKTQHPSSKFCSRTIADFCGVINWYSPRDRADHAFGMNGDVEMFEFLMDLIYRSMDRSWKDYLGNNPPRPGVSRHTEYWSFMFGFADRVNAKLRDLMSKRETHTMNDGTSLVVKKYEVIEAGMRALLPHIKIRETHGRGIRGDDAAAVQGAIAGDKVNLNRPLHGKGAALKQIK